MDSIIEALGWLWRPEQAAEWWDCRGLRAHRVPRRSSAVRFCETRDP